MTFLILKTRSRQRPETNITARKKGAEAEILLEVNFILDAGTVS